MPSINKVRAFAAGEVAYVTKPFPEMAANCGRHLNQGQGQSFISLFQTLRKPCQTILSDSSMTLIFSLAPLSRARAAPAYRSDASQIVLYRRFCSASPKRCRPFSELSTVDNAEV